MQPQVACVDVPALPLQLLLREHPKWRDLPVAVVRDDRPQGVILWANLQARRARILPGMTFAAARSLAGGLRAAVVADEVIANAVAELHLSISNFSPRVEASTREPGVFFVDTAGLVPLYGSFEQWAATLRDALGGRGFQSTTVMGFHRYRAYALARGRNPGTVWLVADPTTEARLAARVPLEQLDVSPDLRDHLRVLGIRTLGEFLRLPAPELRARFGPEAAQLHALASDRCAPLSPRKLVDPIRSGLQLEPPDADHTRLLFGLRGVLHRLMGELAQRGQAMTVLHLHLHLDHAPAHDEWIEPASPTLDVQMVVDLVRLRLESLTLPAAVEEVTVELDGIRATARQLAMFDTRQRRDLEAGNRALARLRAALGPSAVTRGRLRAAHLPEATFEWESVQQLSFPKSVAPPLHPPPLCRRLLSRPIPLPPRPRHDPSAWLDRRGAVTRMHGPYRVSGGWWVRTVERDYYFAETQQGEVLWIFYDRPRRRWFLHGYVD